jgi:predicted acetyltransferase
MAVEIRNYLDGFDDRTQALRAVADLDETVFGEVSHEEDLDSPIYGVVDDDRTFLAWDGDVIVGMSANFTLDTSTPGGGSLPTAGVTFIGVRPTHRRRGVMSQMLHNLHTDGIKRNEPIATLWAADPAIYGRFGYGLATQRVSAEVPHQHGALLDAPEDPSIRLRMIDVASDYELTKPVYDAMRRERGGVPAIDERWHARHTYDPAHHRDGGTRAHTILAEDDNGVRGFLRYSMKSAWPNGYGAGTVNVYRLMSTDPAAHAALWRYCFAVDLMEKTHWWNVPIDDPVLTWLEHSRQAQLQVRDAMWLRLLDLPAALSGRSYASDLDVTLEVTDRQFDQNAGKWRLSGGPDGATCERTRASADISLDIRSLGAALLGGTTLTSHARAGWLHEHTPGSVSAASAAFRSELAPYCPFVF